jgi:flagellar FliL protein
MFKKVLFCIFYFTLLSSIQTVSADEEAAAPEVSDYQYFAFEPDIITNYIKTGKHLGYIRLGVDLMVKSAANYAEVEMHEPLIRDRIITILGEQTEAQIKSITEREVIRTRCLTEANDAIFKITGNRPIENLLFTKYLEQ